MKIRVAAAAFLALTSWPAASSFAIPSFAQQTGQPCSACHVGAFGPQLKPYGRDFKLYGYISNDGQKHLPPLALTLQSSYTQTAGDLDATVAGFKVNDNFLGYQQISGYYGGRIAGELGAFIQVSHDQVGHAWHWDNTDIRFAHPLQLFGQDSVVGLTVNNNPTAQDLWNSTPVWGFPYNASSLAPSPSAATLADGNLGQHVLGAGAFVSWNALLYLEGAVYDPLSRALQEHLGVGPAPDETPDAYDGAIPYGRVALEHAGDRHYFEAGAFVLSAQRYPGGNRTAAATDGLLDRAFDATYQFTGSTNQVVSAHAIYIHEAETLRADQVLNATRAGDTLRTARGDLSYSFRDTWTPSLQIFATTGSKDAALWGTPNGSPDTRGYVAEIAYVPFGKAPSRWQWANLRIAAQYVSYDLFNGSAHGASQYNTLYLSLWLAAAPLYAVEKSAPAK